MTTAAATPAIPTIKQDRILILDFGSQYSQLIARRVRDSGVFCEMFRLTSTPSASSILAQKALSYLVVLRACTLKTAHVSTMQYLS